MIHNQRRSLDSKVLGGPHIYLDVEESKIGIIRCRRTDRTDAILWIPCGQAPFIFGTFSAVSHLQIIRNSCLVFRAVWWLPLGVLSATRTGQRGHSGIINSSTNFYDNYEWQQCWDRSGQLVAWALDSIKGVILGCQLHWQNYGSLAEKSCITFVKDLYVPLAGCFCSTAITFSNSALSVLPSVFQLFL